MDKMSIIVIIVLLVPVYDSAEISKANDLCAVVIDGPWTSLPEGTSSDLAFDSDWGALTLQSDLTNFDFLLSPHTNKALPANIVRNIAAYNGRLYPSYGDIAVNFGPVDIVSYDPLTGKLISEMLNVPEDSVNEWYTSDTGRFYVAGGDARESWTFGNFFVNDGLGWQKKRTIYNGVHVNEVVEFQGYLFTQKNVDQPPLFDFPYILVSDNQGASWSYEQIDPGPLDSTPPYSSAVVSGFEIVTQQIHDGFDRKVDYLYATFVWNQAGEGKISRLYRFDGKKWERIRIYTPSGEPTGSITIVGTFKGQLLVFCSVTGSETYLYALDGLTQQELPFLKNRFHLGSPGEMFRYAEYDGWLYCILRDQYTYGDLNLSPRRYILCRTQDLINWQTIGPIFLPPGAKPCTLGFVHSRLYVGTANMVLGYEPGYVESRQCYVYAIHNSTLQWDAEIPVGSSVSFKIRTSYSKRIPNDLPWVGPDGTENTVFTSSGQFLHPRHNGDDVLQVAIYKTPNNDGEYPHVRSLTLNSPDGTVSLAVDEGAGLYTAVNSTDPNGAEYISGVFALQEPIAGGNLFYEGAVPDQTSLYFQVRSGSTEDALSENLFIGPDGTPNTVYESSGQELWSGHNGDTYIQYRAILSSTEPILAPFLRKAVLTIQRNKLDHFNIRLVGPGTWKAGQSNPITVQARTADGTLVPIEGRVSLSAIAEDSGDSVPIQPKEMSLVSGVGTSNVLLQRATPTQICIELADIKSCSTVINVQPGEAHSVMVETDLTEPHLHWSPVGQAGQLFTLSLTIQDRYRNPVTGYTGTIRCERWRWQSEGQLMAPYTFEPTDNGFHEFTSGVTIDETGEWNIVCYDETTPQIAGTLTVNIQ
jgi:hypothetical protein